LLFAGREGKLFAAKQKGEMRIYGGSPLLFFFFSIDFSFRCGLTCAMIPRLTGITWAFVLLPSFFFFLPFLRDIERAIAGGTKTWRESESFHLTLPSLPFSY